MRQRKTEFLQMDVSMMKLQKLNKLQQHHKEMTTTN